MSWDDVSAGYKNISSMHHCVCRRDGEREKRVIHRVAPAGSIYSTYVKVPWQHTYIVTISVRYRQPICRYRLGIGSRYSIDVKIKNRLDIAGISAAYYVFARICVIFVKASYIMLEAYIFCVLEGCGLPTYIGSLYKSYIKGETRLAGKLMGELS